MFMIQKRNGTALDFDISKIVQAIEKAMEARCNQATVEESENYRKFVRVMAELDWPAFLEYDPKLHAEVLSCVNSSNLDGITEALYNHFNALFLKDLQDRCEASQIIQSQRMPAIREALLLYQLGYYYGSVAILVTQLAGIVSDIDTYITVSGRTYDTENLRLINSRYKVSSKNEKGLAIKALLEAKDIDGVTGEYDYLIGYFRMKVFGSNLSGDALCEHANRHAICHGDQCNYGSKEHALKTILCIDALEHVADILTNDDSSPD